MLNLREQFSTTIVMSGTPQESQVNISKLYPENVCSCSPLRAMSSNIICKPSLNLIKILDNKSLPSAIISLVKREQNKYKNELFKTKVLFCANGINEIHEIIRYLRTYNISKNWHFVGIHSEKKVSINNEEATYEAFVDNKIVSSTECFSILEEIDRNTYEPFNDNQPIIVFQVDMIGEGINLNSFNSVYINTNSTIKQMQQIGRVLRDSKDSAGNCKKDRNFGHANVYCGYKNKKDLEIMFNNLEACELTSEAFDWGDHLDVSNSSIPEEDPDAISEATEFIWEPINDAIDIKILKDCEASAFTKHIMVDANTIEKLTKYLLKHKEVANKFNKSFCTSLKKALEKKEKEVKENISITKKEDKNPESLIKDFICKLYLSLQENIYGKGEQNKYLRPLFSSTNDFYRAALELEIGNGECFEIVDNFFRESRLYNRF